MAVIQWATGTVGIHAVPGHRRPSRPRAGRLWVHSDSKAGRDAGELCGGPALGVIATQDADALLDLKTPMPSATWPTPTSAPTGDRRPLPACCAARTW
jgi:hypothetical protein